MLEKVKIVAKAALMKFGLISISLTELFDHNMFYHFHNSNTIMLIKMYILINFFISGQLKIPKHIRFENIIFPFDDVIVLPAEEGNAASTSLDDLMKKMEQLNDETAVTQAPAKKKSKKYIGQVECISYGRVTFKCDQKIPSDKMYTILFRPSRMILRYQYRALEQLVAMSPPLLKRFLFPDQILMREMPALK